MLFPRQLDAGGTNKDGQKSRRCRPKGTLTGKQICGLGIQVALGLVSNDWSEHALQTLVSLRSGGYFGGGRRISFRTGRRLENQHPDAQQADSGPTVKPRGRRSSSETQLLQG